MLVGLSSDYANGAVSTSWLLWRPSLGAEAAHLPEMVEKLVAFGLARSTVVQLIGRPRASKETADRRVAYCRLRGRAANTATTPFSYELNYSSLSLQRPGRAH